MGLSCICLIDPISGVASPLTTLTLPSLQGPNTGPQHQPAMRCDLSTVARFSTLEIRFGTLGHQWDSEKPPTVQSNVPHQQLLCGYESKFGTPILKMVTVIPKKIQNKLKPMVSCVLILTFPYCLGYS